MVRCTPTLRWRLRLVGNGILLTMVFVGTLPQLRCGCVTDYPASSPCPLADCRCDKQICPIESLSCCSASRAPQKASPEDLIRLHVGSPACHQVVEFALSGTVGTVPGSGDAVADASVHHTSAAIPGITEFTSRSLVEVDPLLVQDRVIQLRRLLI